MRFLLFLFTVIYSDIAFCQEDSSPIPITLCPCGFSTDIDVKDYEVTDDCCFVWEFEDGESSNDPILNICKSNYKIGEKLILRKSTDALNVSWKKEFVIVQTSTVEIPEECKSDPDCGVPSVISSNEKSFQENCECESACWPRYIHTLNVKGELNEEIFVFKDTHVIYGNECDEKLLDLSIPDGYDFCDKEITWSLNSSIISEGSRMAQIKSNQTGNITITHCGDLLFSIEKMNYSTSPFVQFLGGLENPPYNGEYGWDNAGNETLKNLNHYEHHTSISNDYYVKVLTLLGNGRIQGGGGQEANLKLVKSGLNELYHGSDPNFRFYFNFNEEAESDLRINDQTSLSLSYSELKELDKIKITCLYNGPYRSVAKQINHELTVKDQCESLCGDLHIGYTNPKVIGLNYYKFTFEGLPTIYPEPTQILTILSVYSLNQLFFQFSITYNVRFQIPSESVDEYRVSLESTNALQFIDQLLSSNPRYNINNSNLFSTNFLNSRDPTLGGRGLTDRIYAIVYGNANLKVYSHEIAHGLGLFHTFYDDTQAGVPPNLPILPRGSTRNYLDYYNDPVGFFLYQIKMRKR